MEAVYPAGASALARGRRRRSAGVRARHRTLPVTFAEIKEVDEENLEEEESASRVTAERRRPDLLQERLGRQFTEFRRRRERAQEHGEPGQGEAGVPDAAGAPSAASGAADAPSAASGAADARACSEPS